MSIYENELTPQFGRFFRFLREADMLTLQEVSSRAGITKGTLSRIETGNSHGLTLQLFIALCSALDTDPVAALRRYLDGEDLYTPPETVVIGGVTYRKEAAA